MRIQFSIITFVAVFLTQSALNIASANTEAGDKIKGESLSQTCLGCHGAPGMRNASPVYRVPMIGGQNAEYIVAALKTYKDKTRSHPTMQAQAASLSEQDMIDISLYFEGLKNTAYSPKDEPTAEEIEKANERMKELIERYQDPKKLGTKPLTNLELGEVVAQLKCATCHGADGNTNSASKTSGFPSLAGQYDDYIKRALLDYKSGKRQNAIMSGQSENLSKQDIKNLALWFRSQEGKLSAPVIKIKK